MRYVHVIMVYFISDKSPLLVHVPMLGESNDMGKVTSIV